jgi:hypothetical protein
MNNLYPMPGVSPWTWQDRFTSRFLAAGAIK